VAHWQVTAHRAAHHYANYNVRSTHTGRGALGCVCGAQSQQADFVTAFKEIPNLSLPFAPSKFDRS